MGVSMNPLLGMSPLLMLLLLLVIALVVVVVRSCRITILFIIDLSSIHNP